MLLFYMLFQGMFSLMALMMRLIFSPVFLVIGGIVVICAICAGLSAFKHLLKFIILMTIIICIFYSCNADKMAASTALIMNPAFMML